MSAPNLLSPTTVTGKLWPFALTTANTAVTVVANSAASGTSVYVRSLYVTNITSGAVVAIVDVKRSSTVYRGLGKAVVLPPGNTINFLQGGPITLEESDTLEVTCDTLNGVEGFGSGEVIS